MGRVINIESAGKERTQLVRSVILAIRELMHQQETSELTFDLAAYIALALQEIAETIDVSVAAWEKRGYWVKADRFRMDWIWTEQYAEKMKKALVENDWATVALTAGQIAQKLADTKVPQRSRIGTPWIGAWEKIQQNGSHRA